jgi:hypothetical protein
MVRSTFARRHIPALALAMLAGLSLRAAAPAGAAQVVAYHGKSAATHQDKFDALAPIGFRMVSLSISGKPSDARYAAVWVKQAGPAFQAWHGLSSAQYDSIVDSNAPWGWRPEIVSATSSGSSEAFACVLVKDNKPWFAKHGINGVSFQGYCNQAKEDGFILTCAAIYGPKETPKYAGIWVKNAQNIDWSYTINATWAQLVDISKDKVDEDGYRLAYVTLSPHQRYVGVFYKQPVSWDWDCYGNLTSGEYQLKFNDYSSSYYPMCVQAGGSGDDRRYVVIFREN